MRIDCPLCGTRDRREFYYSGHATALARPAPDAGAQGWVTEDLWHHEFGCGAWLAVRRDTVSHAVLSARLVKGDQL